VLQDGAYLRHSTAAPGTHTVEIVAVMRRLSEEQRVALALDYQIERATEVEWSG
jgi:hypothetical protein